MTTENVGTPQASSLDDVFNDNASTPAQESKQPDAVEQERVDLKEPEESQSDTGDEKNGETPAPKEESWTKEMALDERKKRQELEKEKQRLEAEIAALREPKNQDSEAKRPDVLDDPEGAFSYTESRLQDALWKQKVDLTSELMAEKHADFEEMKDHFIEMAKNDAALAQRLRNATNPAKFAYEAAKKDLDFRKFSDPEYQKKLEEEIRAKILAEMNDSEDSPKTPAEEKPKLNLPKSFSNKTNLGNDNPKLHKAKDDELFKGSPF